MSSLSDQLLKAGLVTKEQVKKAAEKPKRNFNAQKNSQRKSKGRSVSSAGKENQKASAKNEQSDLAKFYQERSKIERKEKEEAIRSKKEATRIRKEANRRVNLLISKNQHNNDTAEIRYNFVIGTTIKYLFVTEQQQQGLVDGKLAITFLNGKKCLIPVDIGQEILKINPQKIVIIPVE